MKKFSKITVFILSAMCFLCFASTALAGETVTVQKADMNITMPDNWYVFNKPLNESDSVFDIFDYQTVSELIEENQKECVALNKQSTADIEIMVTDSPDIYNLKDLEEYFSDEEIQQEILDLNTGIFFDNAYVYNSGNIKYVFFDYATNDPYAMGYMTFVNGKQINITYCNYNTQPFSQQQIIEFQNVVDSITFNQVNPTPQNYYDNYTEQTGTNSTESPLYKALASGVASAAIAAFFVIRGLIRNRLSKSEPDTTVEDFAKKQLQKNNAEEKE